MLNPQALQLRVGVDVGSQCHSVAVGLTDGSLLEEFEITLEHFPVIPTDVIHDTLAHFRRVMEASRSGMVRRSFQAMQQASTMAS